MWAKVRLRHRAFVEGVGIGVGMEFVLNPPQEVAIMKVLQRPPGLATGHRALLLLGQTRPLLLYIRM